jgi:hypothetical protein
MRHSVNAIFVLLAASLLLGGCATTGTQTPDFEQRLSKVTAGNVEVTPTETLAYEDEFIRVEWAFPDGEIGRINFSLENKSDSEISILWNEASYVDPSGTTQDVLHDDMSMYEVSTARLQPRDVPPRARTSTVIIPEKHVRGTAGGAQYAPLISREAQGQRTVRLILPMKYKDRVARYSFYFKIWVANEEIEPGEGI